MGIRRVADLPGCFFLPLRVTCNGQVRRNVYSFFLSAKTNEILLLLAKRHKSIANVNCGTALVIYSYALTCMHAVRTYHFSRFGSLGSQCMNNGRRLLARLRSQASTPMFIASMSPTSCIVVSHSLEAGAPDNILEASCRTSRVIASALMIDLTRPIPVPA